MTLYEPREIDLGLETELEQKTRKRACNRHFDCDEADERARARGWSSGADHCHDECCEDCFGN